MSRINNNDKFSTFRKEFPWLKYEEYSYELVNDRITLSFTFNLSDRHLFRPTYTIPVKEMVMTENLSGMHANQLVAHIGMIELISYWKAACPPHLIVPFHLSDEQIRWWKKLYFMGLGEFFYLNNIQTDQEGFMDILASADHLHAKKDVSGTGSFIVPIGGGKDSAVTLEMLSKTENTIIPFIINPRQASLDTIAAAGFKRPQLLEFSRSIDPLLLELNRIGFLNGHTPFSALLAFCSLFAAHLTSASHIALSNESSANEPTIPGTGINHQYSKSYEFEADFRHYVKKFLPGSTNYFSFLRPLSEMKIAELFSKMPAYHQIFKSCNAGSKDDSWCGKCPKCLFTYIVLAPFIPSVKLNSLFGKNMLDDPTLQPVLDELTGISKNKPFECIGTTDEVNVAICVLIGLMRPPLPVLLEYYSNTDRYPLFRDSDISTLLNSYDKHNFLPRDLNKILKRRMG